MKNSYEKVKLVCFDLDDTLIRDIHSVMLPCILNGKEKEHAAIQKQEDAGIIDYILADHLRARLLKGLEVIKIEYGFLDIAKPLKHIREVVNVLHQHSIRSIVITVGSIQVAEVVCALWGFDACYGSEYELKDGLFTGSIVHYVKAENKIDCLKDYCLRFGIEAYECIAVGDGSTDIPLFCTAEDRLPLTPHPT